MRNPFDFQKSDAEFAEATRDKRKRQAQISRLGIARSWNMVFFAIVSAFALLTLALDPRAFIENKDNFYFYLFICALNAASFAHLDLQIKFLKASDGDDR